MFRTRRRPPTGRVALLGLLALASGAPGAAQQDEPALEIFAHEVAPGVHLLGGPAGNVAVSVGREGVLLAGDPAAVRAEPVLEGVRRLAPGTVRFVLETHAHAEGVRGGEELVGAGAVVVAHERAWARRRDERPLGGTGAARRPTPPASAGASSALSFAEGVTIHLNGQEVHAFHVARAHTDGDAIVHFRGADVVHMGDTFVRDRLPWIDTAAGGSIDGLIAALGAAIAVMGPSTKVIPGHGALSTRADVLSYRDALQAIRDEVEAILVEGHPLEHLLDFRPARAYAEAWGQDRAAEDAFVAQVYEGLESR